MGRRREVIGPDGTDYPMLELAAKAAGVSSSTMEKWTRVGTNGWRRGDMKGHVHSGEKGKFGGERGALVSPVSILESRPVDPDDPRLWM